MNAGFTWNIKNILLLAVMAILVLGITYSITTLGEANGIMIAGAIIASGVGVYSLINYEFGFLCFYCSGLRYIFCR